MKGHSHEPVEQGGPASLPGDPSEHVNLEAGVVDASIRGVIPRGLEDMVALHPDPQGESTQRGSLSKQST